MNSIVERLIDPAVQKQLLFFKVVSIISSLFFFGIIVFTRKKTKWLRINCWKQLQAFRNMKPYEVIHFGKRWKQTQEKLRTGSKSDAKLAAIEVDELLDDVLKMKAFRGDNIEERLSRVKKEDVPNLQELLSVRETKEIIVDNPDIDISLSDIHRMMEVYDKSLRSLGVID